MNKDEVYDYYRAKFKSYAEYEDKADPDGIAIGMYLTLAAVAKAAMCSTNIDAGWLLDLEKSAHNAVDQAYEDEDIYE